jgi:hypothetical protein
MTAAGRQRQPCVIAQQTGTIAGDLVKKAGLSFQCSAFFRQIGVAGTGRGNSIAEVPRLNPFRIGLYELFLQGNHLRTAPTQNNRSDPRIPFQFNLKCSRSASRLGG